MSVNIKNFVDIDIKSHVPISTVGTRDTTVLFTSEYETAPTDILVTAENYKTLLPNNIYTNAAVYADVYFKNGGVKLLVKTGRLLANIETEIRNSEDNYICFAYATGTDSFLSVQSVAVAPTWQANTYYNKVADEYVLLTEEPSDWAENYFSYYEEESSEVYVAVSPVQAAPEWIQNKYYKKENNIYVLLSSEPVDWSTAYTTYYEKSTPYIDVLTAFKSIATSLETNTYGTNEKMLFARTNSTTNTDSINNIAVKYSSVQGAEMTIPAYLSRINVYAVDTVQDYMYTQETISPEYIDDDEYVNITTGNMNVDIELAGAVRNCGGNLLNGLDIVNGYVLIILHQTLTYKLISLLSQKLKNSIGLSKIYAVMSQELSEYLTCGYLTTDKIWTDPDWNVTYNNETYTIIETGTALTDGYSITILPFSSLTEQDKAERKTPPIYVVIATQYGIRKIVINGEVI